jgi:hypothetical protein
MILISHRGNLEGKIESEENKSSYIDHALSLGFEVELDIRMLGTQLFLGHDEPSEEVSEDWLLQRKDRLWIHCKNISALNFFHGTEFNHFWHQKDDYTLTSRGFIWAYPGKELSSKSIAVVPETWTSVQDLDCAGICSDFILEWFSKNPLP